MKTSIINLYLDIFANELYIGFSEPTTEYVPSYAHRRATIERLRSAVAQTIAENMHDSIHPELRDFVQFQTVIHEGNVSEQILAYAEAEEVDTIVLSSRPRRPWRRWAPTIAEQVMRQAACRILLVHHPQFWNVVGPALPSLSGE